ncbi:MAG TPA: zf-TFIIB domain-containing protein [Verrucomicrobiae bacterium]
MICPACSRELTETQVGAVVVDVCHGGCGGIWFDLFELQRVDEQHEAAGEPLLNIPRDPAIQVDFSRKRACPRCDGIKLKRHFFSAKRQIEVDQCPNCGGYWLDAGELEAIRAEKSAKPEVKPGAANSISIEMIRYLYRVRIEGSQKA